MVDKDLVVDDDVDGAAHAVVRQAGHVQRLHHDALPREGAVAVQHDGHHPPALGVADVELLRTHLAQLRQNVPRSAFSGRDYTHALEWVNRLVIRI
eukprot:5984813-Pyramimonas_sp.AAC.1